MSIRRIVTVQEGNPVLRSKAKPVKRVTAEIRALMDDMVETMREAPGVGLAAPQVDVPLRVIVVETPLDFEDPQAGMRLLTLANPEIVSAEQEMVEDQEACLSIPGLYGDVPRHVVVRIRGIDRDGQRVDFSTADFEARVVQHEIDHLEGVLFTDRVTGMDKLYTLHEDDSGELVQVPYSESVPAL